VPHVRSIEQFRDALALMPDGAMLPAGELREWLRDVPPTRAPAEASGMTWLEKLWTVPPDTRLNTAQAAEALGKSKNWLRERLEEIPHVRFAGENQFKVGDLRQWLTTNEQIARTRLTEIRLTRDFSRQRAR